MTIKDIAESPTRGITKGARLGIKKNNLPISYSNTLTVRFAGFFDYFCVTVLKLKVWL